MFDAKRFKRNLSPIDLGNALRRWMKLNGTKDLKKVALEFPYLPESKIRQLVSLHRLTAAVQTEVNFRRIDISTAEILAKVKDEAEQERYAAKVVAGEMTLKQLTQTVSPRKKGDSEEESQGYSHIGGGASTYRTFNIQGAGIVIQHSSKRLTKSQIADYLRRAADTV